MQSSPGSVDIRNILSVCRVGEALNRGLLRELLGYFIDENQRRMATLTQAVDAGNRDTLRHVGHAVRGSAAMLGAGRLHDLAWCLELDAAETDLTALRGAVDALGVELDAVVTALHNAHPEAWTD
ncbi:MAG TPA: Hpt domain-containing protein [Vicinamibacterales bacterium]|nr:Hpt domain-containing protein [Vicinamibacterales bacterium]